MENALTQTEDAFRKASNWSILISHGLIKSTTQKKNVKSFRLSANRIV
jgi:hypothetical protein